MKTNYKSIPVIASIIGSKTRTAMYLMNITSLDGSRTYQNKWIPTRWKRTTKVEWRYDSVRYNLQNVLISPGKYYKFHYDESVLMTDGGPVNMWGDYLDVKGLRKVKTSVKQSIQWEYHSQSLYELPMSQVTDKMIIDRHDSNNLSNINCKLVNKKVVEYYQVRDRYIVYLPTWLINTMIEKQNIKIDWELEQSKINQWYMFNDNKFETVAEETAKNSVIQTAFNYIDRTNIDFKAMDSIQQWELDNPEYKSHA